MALHGSASPSRYVRFMSPRKKAKVYRVKLVPPDELTLFPDHDEYIQAALTAGRSTERYGREWIVGRTTQVGDVLTGRIGFRGAEGMVEVWDDEDQDFREVAVPAGLTSPFAVNLRTLQMALQPRGAIKLNGLIGAFRNLLTQEGDQWRVLTPEKEMSFSVWRASVDRVVSVKFRLRKPNPHYQGTPDLEAVLEQAEAEVAALELQSEAGIDTNAPFVQQSQHHVERGYGESRYVGLRGVATSEPRESVYNSNLGSEEEALEVAVGEDGEVSQSDLSSTLALAAGGQDTGDHEQGQDNAGA